MASPTWWTWVWVNSGSWWWTGRPGMLQFIGSQRVGHNWATELNWTGANQRVMLPSPGRVPRGLSCKAPAHAGDVGPSPGWEQCPGGGNGTPLQCSCWENPMDRGAWWATVHGVTKSPMWVSTRAGNHRYPWCYIRTGWENISYLFSEKESDQLPSTP